MLDAARHLPIAERLEVLLDAVSAGASAQRCYAQFAARSAALIPDREMDQNLVSEVFDLVAQPQGAALLVPDVTARDIVHAQVLVPSMLVGGPTSEAMGRRIGMLVRRGLAPNAQRVQPMPPLPVL